MMVRKNSTPESEDGVLSYNSPPANDDDSLGESSNGGKVILKKGPWTSAEDAILTEYVRSHGEGNWNSVQTQTGLARCGKSCRLRWANHLRPNLKKGAFTSEEERLIIELHAKMGNKWARMAAHLPGRTDNEIKNYWNTRIKRRQRSGQPLYPPDLYFSSPPDSHQTLRDISSNDGFVFEKPILEAEGDDLWLDELIQGYGRGDDSVAGGQIQGFLLLPQLYVDQDTNYVTPPSVSEKLTTGDQKSELPSLQYQEATSVFLDLKNDDPVPEHRRFPGSTGLLQDLIYESTAISKSESRSSIDYDFQGSKNAYPISDSNGYIPDGSWFVNDEMEFIDHDADADALGVGLWSWNTMPGASELR